MKTILTLYLLYTYHIIVSLKMSTSKIASKFRSRNGIKIPFGKWHQNSIREIAQNSDDGSGVYGLLSLWFILSMVHMVHSLWSVLSMVYPDIFPFCSVVYIPIVYNFSILYNNSIAAFLQWRSLLTFWSLYLVGILTMYLFLFFIGVVGKAC